MSKLAEKYQSLAQGRKDTLKIAAQSDNAMFKILAAMCGFNTDNITLNGLRVIIAGGNLPFQNQNKKKEENTKDWGNSSKPPFGTPSKIKIYWPTTSASRRFYACLLLEMKWSNSDKTFFVQTTKQMKKAIAIFKKTQIAFNESKIISCARHLNIEGLKEYLIEQKSKKWNNNDRKLKIIASNYINAVNSAQKMILDLNQLLRVLDDDIVNKLQIAKVNNYSPGGYSNKSMRILGGGRRFYAPNTFGYYIDLVKRIKSLKNVIERCKNSIMDLGYNSIGLNKASLKLKAKKYQKSRERISKKQRAKRQKDKVDDICIGFPLLKFMFVKLNDPIDGLYGFEFLMTMLDWESIARLSEVNKMSRGIWDMVATSIIHYNYVDADGNEVLAENGNPIFDRFKPLTIAQLGLQQEYNKVKNS